MCLISVIPKPFNNGRIITVCVVEIKFDLGIDPGDRSVAGVLPHAHLDAIDVGVPGEAVGGDHGVAQGITGIPDVKGGFQRLAVQLVGQPVGVAV